MARSAGPIRLDLGPGGRALREELAAGPGAAALRLEEILATQANILDDIELGVCSVQCAGAIRSEGACHCSCRGDNHGKLWAAR
jgi:hypothetical protein